MFTLVHRACSITAEELCLCQAVSVLLQQGSLCVCSFASVYSARLVLTFAVCLLTALHDPWGLSWVTLWADIAQTCIVRVAVLLYLPSPNGQLPCGRQQLSPV